MAFVDDQLTSSIIAGAIAVHRELGPGLLESTYDECLACELDFIGIRFERQVALPVVYRSTSLSRAYRIDFLVEQQVIVELKAIEKILPVHEAQVLTYLKLSGMNRGLIINFNAVPLKAGIRRLLKKGYSPVSLVSRS